MIVRNKKRLILRVILLLLLLLPQYAIAQPGIIPPDKLVFADFSQYVVEPIPQRQLCNCYLYVKERYGGQDFPSTAQILNHLYKEGNVAVFYYPESNLYHYAYVLKETETTYLIDEANFYNCEHSFRRINKSDPALLGFITI